MPLLKILGCTFAASTRVMFRCYRSTAVIPVVVFSALVVLIVKRHRCDLRCGCVTWRDVAERKTGGGTFLRRVVADNAEVA
jgi:hypothetical protein